MKRPSVAVVAPNLDTLGGQSIQADMLMARLREEGVAVTFIPINPTFRREFRWLRRLRYLRTICNQQLYLPSLIRLKDSDVVHVFSASYWAFLLSAVPALVVAKSLGKRAILNYHSGEADDHLARWGILVHPWLRLADEIIVPSEYLSRVFTCHGYHARIIRNVVDLSRFRYRERIPIRPHLLSTRNFEPHYGVDNTIEAFSLVKSRYPDATLTIAGSGSEDRRLRQMAMALATTDIRFVGQVDRERMPDLYDQADIFVNSSTIDNQPISVLEAFAAGMYVVSTTPGDLQSMVRDRVTGVVVPARNPTAMAEAIIGLLEDPALGVLARQARIEVEQFTWPHVIQQWLEAYAA